MKLIKFTALLGVLCLAVLNFGCKSNLTAETSGQVTNVVIDRDKKTKTKKTSSNRKKKTTTVSIETEIDYSYTVNGTGYQGYSEKDGDVARDFQNGSTVVVCYNPASPSESDVFPAGTKCGS